MYRLTLLRRLRTAMSEPLNRLRLSLAVLALLMLFGTLGYMLLERMEAVDALYMTVITITTVGFGEVIPLDPPGRVFTIVLIIVGIGAATGAASNAIEVLIGQRFWQSVQKRRMERNLMTIDQHYIVCGFGRIGRQIVRDLIARKEPFMVIDANPEVGELLMEEEIPHVIGDATRDEILQQAGIERARGFVAALNSDADNVMAVLSARGLNPQLYIVARAARAESVSKLQRAGADHVVSPYEIGGRRIALALVRPVVHDFFNQIFDVDDADVDIGQVYVRPGSRLAGQTIGGCDLRSVRSLTILAIRKPNGEFTMNPNAARQIETGDTLIVIGPPQAIYQVEDDMTVNSPPDVTVSE